MKKVASGGSDRGRVKVRFFEIEMDGDTDALQESIRALTSAINKPTHTPQRHLNGAVHAQKHLQNTPETIDGEITEQVDVDANDPIEEETPVPTKVRQRAKRTPPTPQILDDPGFDQADPTWSDFASSKPLENDMLKVTAVAVWFKRTKKIDTITINHAYTAFKYLDWPTPDDIGQAFRNAKRTKHWFGTDGDGNWTVNIVGINAIDKLKKGE